MLLRFCIKVYSYGRSNTYYIKDYTIGQAVSKFISKHPSLEFTKIELLGDALPAPQVSVAKLVKEEKIKKANKTKRWQAALKYQKRAGFSPLTVKTAKYYPPKATASKSQQKLTSLQPTASSG